MRISIKKMNYIQCVCSCIYSNYCFQIKLEFRIIVGIVEVVLWNLQGGRESTGARKEATVHSTDNKGGREGTLGTGPRAVIGKSQALSQLNIPCNLQLLVHGPNFFVTYWYISFRFSDDIIEKKI